MDTLFIKTYGCQMNEYDSGRIVALMKKAYGLRLVDTPDQADVILLNTCSVREKAEDKVYSELGRLRHFKEKNPNIVIGVGGCVAQQEQKRIFKRAPYVDVVFGPQTYHRLPEMVKQVRRDRVQITAIDMPEIEKFDHLPQRTSKRISSYVTIMEGCDKFCTFCVVPYTRGTELSRPVSDVLAECGAVLEAGTVEITLLGQNVNGYRANDGNGEEWDFATLLYAVSALPRLQRLRFTTSHPIEVNDGLIQAFAELGNNINNKTAKLMPYLHLPVQSGSDRILKAMHRGHTRAQYIETIAKLRTACPELSLSSDFIIGYPGETEEDFAATLSLVEEIGFDTAYCFKYSPRPGTPASQIKDDVPESEKNERLQRLLALMRIQTHDALQRQIGKKLAVLIDKMGKHDGDVQGRAPDMKIVHLQGNERLIGKIIMVKIIKAYGLSLRGEVVSEINEIEETHNG
ncbi:MAG: tRNA (N6-isopentenyl adenosine(37)-C2)-methylthiotransferase MiaB [Mariprofundales bacterium]